MTCPICGSRCIRHKTGNALGTLLTPWRCSQCDWDEEFDKEEGEGRGDARVSRNRR